MPKPAASSKQTSPVARQLLLVGFLAILMVLPTLHAASNVYLSLEGQRYQEASFHLSLLREPDAQLVGGSNLVLSPSGKGTYSLVYPFVSLVLINEISFYHSSFHLGRKNPFLNPPMMDGNNLQNSFLNQNRNRLAHLISQLVCFSLGSFK